MSSRLAELFEDARLAEKIQGKLPHLFTIAQLESQRAGKTGMEVGSLRERILIALLIYKFGEENIETQIPITEPETDVKVSGEPVAIKTITGMGGVKVIWTVDAQSALRFQEGYSPSGDMLLAQILWNRRGGLFWVPLEVQREVFSSMGRDGYLKLPKPGTNPRGVEFSREALTKLLEHKGTRRIDIFWQWSSVEYNAYARWVDYWRED